MASSAKIEQWIFTGGKANSSAISVFLIASSSLVTEWVKGKTLDEAQAIKNTDIAEELALPPVKIHCSILAEDAIKAAIADYKHKKGLV
jgi:nitrogen fixation NifU-like protein